MIAILIAAALVQTVPSAADTRTLDRALFRSTATQAMRVHRFANIGTACGLLSSTDAEAIHASATAMMDEARALVDRRDADWAAAYVEGLRDGAMRSADLHDVADGESCRHFAIPGGPLDRILTWTGKPPRTVNGVLMSPRTVP